MSDAISNADSGLYRPPVAMIPPAATTTATAVAALVGVWNGALLLADPQSPVAWVLLAAAAAVVVTCAAITIVRRSYQ